MLDVCLLGTGGMMPLPYRYLTAMMARYNGSSILIDCGEGTQMAMHKVGWSSKPIDVICFTHFHADHISGLPGLLLSMGNSERTEPVLIVGPRGIAKVVASLRIIAPELPFVIDCIELTEKEHIIHFDGGYSIQAFKVNHNVACYGYSLIIERQGKFDVEAAKSLNLDVKYWSVLQRGESVELNGKTISPDMVMGPKRKGLKVTYCTDSRPIQEIVDHAAKADLFICEGMYGDPEEIKKAKEKKHMTFQEAAKMAKEAEVSRMWLTHYSPSLNKPSDYIDITRKIFPNAEVCRDGRIVELKFEEESSDSEEKS